MQSFAKLIALSKPLEPFLPLPQWKCIPASLIPSLLIYSNLDFASSMEPISSPNLPEKTVAKF